jgi:hypothetical protein
MNHVMPKPVHKQSLSKPKTVHKRLRALLHEGREANENARLENDGGTKQKRAEREDGDNKGGGEVKAKKMKTTSGTKDELNQKTMEHCELP